MQILGQTPRAACAFTLGVTYRFHNYGSSQLQIYPVASSGSTVAVVNVGTYLDYAPTQATLWLANQDNVSSRVLVEPLVTAMHSGVSMSPLAFVLQSGVEVAQLTGSFFGADGAILTPPGLTDAVVSFSVNSGSAETIANLLFSGSAIWVDAVEFRGVLSGGPVKVVEGSPAANVTTPVTGYVPVANSVVIQPGPVILGPNGVQQPSLSVGSCSECFGAFISSGLQYPDIIFEDIDVTGAGLARLFIRWGNPEAAGDLTVSVYPICYPITDDPLVSTNAVVQESFTAGEEIVINHVEIEPGKYRVVFSTTTEAILDVTGFLQRMQ